MNFIKFISLSVCLVNLGIICAHLFHFMWRRKMILVTKFFRFYQLNMDFDELYLNDCSKSFAKPTPTKTCKNSLGRNLNFVDLAVAPVSAN